MSGVRNGSGRGWLGPGQVGKAGEGGGLGVDVLAQLLLQGGELGQGRELGQPAGDIEDGGQGLVALVGVRAERLAFADFSPQGPVELAGQQLGVPEGVGDAVAGDGMNLVDASTVETSCVRSFSMSSDESLRLPAGFRPTGGVFPARCSSPGSCSPVSEAQDCHYLLYGYVKKSDYAYYAELKLLSRDNKELSATFVSGDDAEHYERLVGDSATKVFNYFRDELGLASKASTNSTGELLLIPAAGYWSSGRQRAGQGLRPASPWSPPALPVSSSGSPAVRRSTTFPSVSISSMRSG